MKFSLSPGEFRELIFSHHPNSPRFHHDVVVLFGRRVCAGCLLAYPTALVIWLIFSPSGAGSILIAICLSLASQLRRLFKGRSLQMFFRFSAGVGLGFGLGGLQWAIQNNERGPLLLLLLATGCYAGFKVYSIRKMLMDG